MTRLALLLCAAASAHPRPSVPLAVLPYDVAFGGIVFVRGTVDGHPASLLFDTGGHGSLNARWSRDAHITVQTGYRASGAGPSVVSASVAPACTWRLGDAQAETRAVVMDLSDLEAVFGRPIDGIVGTEFLNQFVVEIDPGVRRLRIYRPGQYQARAGAAAVPLEFDNDGYAGIAASLEIGERTANGLFMVDTGANGAVDVYQPFAANHGLPVHPASFDELSAGIGGARHYRFERATSLRLAGFDLRAPVAAFSEATDQRYAGLIGMETLRRFVAAFDFPHKTMTLSPLATTADRFTFDGGGLRLLTQGSHFDRVIVARVVAGSAADVAGVKPGDHLLRVGGEDAITLGLESIREECRRPGTLDLVLQRDGAERTAHLVLKPLL